MKRSLVAVLAMAVVGVSARGKEGTITEAPEIDEPNLDDLDQSEDIDLGDFRGSSPSMVWSWMGIPGLERCVVAPRMVWLVSASGSSRGSAAVVLAAICALCVVNVAV